jgi:hypothetical protein
VGGGKEQVVGASVKDKVEWCLVREAALGMDGVSDASDARWQALPLSKCTVYFPSSLHVILLKIFHHFLKYYIFFFQHF